MITHIPTETRPNYILSSVMMECAEFFLKLHSECATQLTYSLVETHKDIIRQAHTVCKIAVRSQLMRLSFLQKKN